MINALFYGDNLDILRNEIPDESVDLIYLDPPFNSNRNYNVLFKEKSGQDSPAQMRAFTDTWTWDEAARDAYTELTQHGPHNVAMMIVAMRKEWSSRRLGYSSVADVDAKPVSTKSLRSQVLCGHRDLLGGAGPSSSACSASITHRFS